MPDRASTPPLQHTGRSKGIRKKRPKKQKIDLGLKRPKVSKAPKSDSKRAKKSLVNPATKLLKASEKIRTRVDQLWRIADVSDHFQNTAAKRKCRIRLLPRRPVETLAAGVAKVHEATLKGESALLGFLDDEKGGKHAQIWAPTISNQFLASLGYTLAMLIQEALTYGSIVSGEPSTKRKCISADAVEYGFQQLYTKHCKLPRLRTLYE